MPLDTRTRTFHPSRRGSGSRRLQGIGFANPIDSAQDIHGDAIAAGRGFYWTAPLIPKTTPECQAAPWQGRTEQSFVLCCLQEPESSPALKCSPARSSSRDTITGTQDQGRWMRAPIARVNDRQGSIREDHKQGCTPNHKISYVHFLSSNGARSDLMLKNLSGILWRNRSQPPRVLRVLGVVENGGGGN